MSTKDYTARLSIYNENDLSIEIYYDDDVFCFVKVLDNEIQFTKIGIFRRKSPTNIYVEEQQFSTDLCKLEADELFQLSTAWDYNIPMHIVKSIHNEIPELFVKYKYTSFITISIEE